MHVEERHTLIILPIEIVNFPTETGPGAGHPPPFPLGVFTPGWACTHYYYGPSKEYSRLVGVAQRRKIAC